MQISITFVHASFNLIVLFLIFLFNRHFLQTVYLNKSHAKLSTSNLIYVNNVYNYILLTKTLLQFTFSTTCSLYNNKSYVIGPLKSYNSFFHFPFTLIWQPTICLLAVQLTIWIESCQSLPFTYNRQIISTDHSIETMPCSKSWHSTSVQYLL